MEKMGGKGEFPQPPDYKTPIGKGGNEREKNNTLKVSRGLKRKVAFTKSSATQPGTGTGN